MDKLIFKVIAFLVAMLLLGCVSRSESTEAVEGTPSIATPFPTEESAPAAILTQTPMSPSSTPLTDCSNPQGEARVEVTSDKLTYQRGETILVTICNYLPDTIFAPPQGDCSVTTVERLENTRWVKEGSCPDLEVYIMSIPSRSQVTHALWTVSQGAENQEPITSEPIPPNVFEGNLQDLSTSTPFQFPAIEVPEGAIAPPFSLLKGDLLPGTYRIKFSFTMGHPTASVETIYSANFIVID